jgi:hypothetical protein
MRIMRLHLHDGPTWASPKVSAYLHVGSTDYFGRYMLHGLLYLLLLVCKAEIGHPNTVEGSQCMQVIICINSNRSRMLGQAYSPHSGHFPLCYYCALHQHHRFYLHYITFLLGTDC